MAIISIVIGGLIFLIFIILLLGGNYKFSGFNLTKDSIDLTYKVGSFIGAIVGPFWALAGVFLYYTALSYQKEDLKVSREAFEIQSFENTFFNLFSTQQTISQNLEGIFSTCRDLKYTRFKVQGSDYFRLSKQALTKITESFDWNHFLGSFSSNSLQDEKDEIEEFYPPWEHDSLLIEENIKQRLKVINKTYGISEEVWKEYSKKSNFDRLHKAYELYLNNHHQEVGHYFRHLYNILKFVDLSNDKFDAKNFRFDAKIYINFIQAQMSSYELMLLFYNIMYFPNTKDLVIKYGVLDNLALEDLIDSCTHTEITGITLKSRSELIKSSFTQDFKTKDKVSNLHCPN